MRFRVRLILLLLTIIITIFSIIGVGWVISNQLLASVDTSFQKGQQLTNVIDQARQAQVSFQRQVQEWKDVLLRGSNPLDKAKYWKGFEDRETQMNQDLSNVNKSLIAMGMNDAAQEAVELLNAHALLSIQYREALSAYPNLTYDDQQAIDKKVRGIDRPTSAGIDKLVNDIQSEATDRFIKDAQKIKEDTNHKNTLILVVVIIVAVLLTLFLLGLLRLLLKSLGADPEDAVEATAKIATGDLTQRLNAKDPTSLMGALEMMQLRLRNISLAIHSIAQDIYTHAGSLPESNQRNQLTQDVENLNEAINRIKIERNNERDL